MQGKRIQVWRVLPRASLKASLEEDSEEKIQRIGRKPMKPANNADSSLSDSEAANPDVFSPGTFVEDPEPRWPAIIAVLCAGGLNYALPNEISLGPRWLLFVIVFVLLVPTILFHRAGHHRPNMVVGHLMAAVMTTFMIISVGLLVNALTHPATHKISPLELLHAAAFLWITNVLNFALWYWRLDAGGPHVRELKAGHASGSFLFPPDDAAGGIWRTGKASPGRRSSWTICFWLSTPARPCRPPTPLPSRVGLKC